MCNIIIPLKNSTPCQFVIIFSFKLRIWEIQCTCNSRFSCLCWNTIMFRCQVRPVILGHQINFKYDGEWLTSGYFWALKGCHDYLWKYGMVMMMIGLNFRHDIFHFQWRGGTQKVDKNFEIVLNKKWNTFFGMFGGSCRYEDK